eukprot:6694911-Alexandrium_andersonii.AAC.1
MGRTGQDSFHEPRQGRKAPHQASRPGLDGPKDHGPGRCLARRNGLVHPHGAGGHVLARELAGQADQ